MGLLCVFVGQYRLHIEGNLLKWKWKCLSGSVIINNRQSDFSRMRNF